MTFDTTLYMKLIFMSYYTIAVCLFELLSVNFEVFPQAVWFICSDENGLLFLNSGVAKYNGSELSENMRLYMSPLIK